MPRSQQKKSVWPCFLLALSCGVIPAHAAQWLKLSTPHFELYTTSGEKQGRETIAHFERVNNFFEKASPLRGESDQPVRIIQFSSEEEFRPYRPIERTTAYFVNGLPRLYIAMSDVSDRGFATAIHEYTHLAIRLSGLRVPLWANEGWAEVNSTLRPAKNETDVGDLIQPHMDVLGKEKWLDFDTLTTVDRNSAIYNEASRAGVFYAESWALMHMMYLAPDYQREFGKFIVALSAGKSADEACREAYGKPGTQVMQDLHSYFDRKQLFGRAFEMKFDAKTEEPVVTKIPDSDANLVLADLLVAIGHMPEAKAAYDQLAAAQPGSTAVAQSLGYYDLANKDAEGARTQFEHALDAGDSDPFMCLMLARLDIAAKQNPIRPLERALQAKPEMSAAASSEIRLQLGVALVAARRFPEAITDLMAMPDVRPERAVPLFCGLTYAYLETGNLPETRRNLETCQKWAKGNDAAMANSLAKLVNARSSGIALAQPGEKRVAVQGTIRQLDCTGPVGRLIFNVGGKDETFFLPPPAAVELNGRAKPGEPSTTLSLGCGMGPKPGNMTLEYVPSPTGIQSAAGLVRRIEY